MPDRRTFLKQSGGAAVAVAMAPHTLTSILTGAPAVHARRAGWEPPAHLVRALPQLMELTAVPGISIVAVNDGEVTWEGCFGAQSVATGAPLRNSAPFEMCSLSKPVFGYLVLALREREIIELDVPANEYLSGTDLQNEYSQRVTVRHLLSHAAGLPNWRRQAEPLELAYPPGDAFGYSGEGYFYLQRIVDALTARAFESLIQELVLQPLNMRCSTFAWSPHVDSVLVQGHLGLSRPVPSVNYASIGRELQHVADAWDRSIAEWHYEDMVAAARIVSPTAPVLPTQLLPNAAVSLFSTALDYAQFMIAMMSDDPGLPVSERSRSEMLTPQIQLNSSLSWGLGWGLEQRQGDEFFWHWGNNEGFRNFAIGERRRRRALIVLTNSTNGHKLYRRVVAESTGAEHDALMWFRT